MATKRITRHNAYVYDCHVCGERFVGYGDDDPKFRTWRDAHNNWHTQGIQEAGRYTMEYPPPAQFRKVNYGARP